MWDDREGCTAAGLGGGPLRAVGRAVDHGCMAHGCRAHLDGGSMLSCMAAILSQRAQLHGCMFCCTTRRPVHRAQVGVRVAGEQAHVHAAGLGGGSQAGPRAAGAPAAAAPLLAPAALTWRPACVCWAGANACQSGAAVRVPTVQVAIIFCCASCLLPPSLPLSTRVVAPYRNASSFLIMCLPPPSLSALHRRTTPRPSTRCCSPSWRRSRS